MKDLLDNDLQNFLISILPEKSELLIEMEKYALENHVSIVEYEVARLINLIVSLKKPKKVLEIGTGLGYSTIHIAEAMPVDGKITSVELLEGRLKVAEGFIERSGLGDKIDTINGDGRIFIEDTQEKYDMIFLDAAKGQYSKFLKRADEILNKNGLIIADNVLINGWVVNLDYPERRKKTMINNMRHFLEDLKENDKYKVSVVPLGDGLGLIWKKDE